MFSENIGKLRINQNTHQFWIGYSILLIILVIITDILTIVYLGPEWNSKQFIDPSDWKRKWILFFAWFKLVMFGLLFFFTFGTIALMPVVNIFIALCIFYNIMVILALGPTFGDEPIYIDDWKKNFILFVSWFSIAIVIISVISVFIPSIYVPQRKFDMWERPTFRKLPMYGPENQYGPFLPN